VERFRFRCVNKVGRIVAELRLADNSTMNSAKTSKPAKSAGSSLIVENRKARFDYFIEDQIEAGIALTGWEVKALRASRGNLKESYAIFRNNEIWLLGANIAPLPSASTHVDPDPVRLRKLLLHRREIDRLRSNVERDGYTVVPLAMRWDKGKVKVTLGLAKGKKNQDKRDTIKDRDWQRQKSRLLRRGS